MEEHEILAQVRAAHGAALAEKLVNHYYPGIYRLAQSILNDAAEADDAAQETFLRALRGWAQFQADKAAGSDSLRRWLAAICIHHCQDRLRRRAARQRLERTLAGLHLARPPQPSVEEQVEQRQGSQALWAAVQQLDEKHRLPIILRFVHGMEIGEIAAALGAPDGTIHSRLHYAVRKLQKMPGVAPLEEKE